MDLWTKFRWFIDNRSSLTRNQKRRQRNFICDYRFPAGLQMKFSREFPHLDVSEREQVFEALRQYLLACHTARRRMVAMPSHITDEAWHAFILFTREYSDFCRNAFGYYLHHTPVEAMASPTQATDGIKRAWNLTCRQESIDPQRPQSLPLLFAIDANLRIANGYIYHLNCHPGTTALGPREYCATHIGCGSDAGGGGSGCGSCGSNGGGCSSGCGSSCGGGGCGGGD